MSASKPTYADFVETFNARALLHAKKEMLEMDIAYAQSNESLSALVTERDEVLVEISHLDEAIRGILASATNSRPQTQTVTNLGIGYKL